MKRFNNLVLKTNFKKVFIVYIIAAIIAGILSAVFLGYEFRDKINFALTYKSVNEKIKDHNLGANSGKQEISALTKNSKDIVDILIVDAENNIVFSAENSSLNQNGTFELQTEDNTVTLINKNNPNEYFRLVNNDSLKITKEMVLDDNEILAEFNDEHFFETGFTNKTLYLLSYAVDKSSGDKIYFISNLMPISNGKLYVKAIAALAVLFFMIYWVFLALWVYTKALKAKMNSTTWGLFTLFTNFVGAIVFVLYKQNNQTCYKCGAIQSKSNSYCTYCGAKIGVNCSKCSAPVSKDDEFCRNCGNRI